MESEAGDKSFDCVKMTREIRDKIYEKTKHMSRSEIIEWYNAVTLEDPFFARLPEAKIVNPAKRRSTV